MDHTQKRVIISFAAGILAGGVSMWLYLKKKHEQELNDEQRYYLERLNRLKDNDDVCYTEEEGESMSDDTISQDIPDVEEEEDHSNEILMGYKGGKPYYAPKPTLEDYERVLRNSRYKPITEETEEDFEMVNNHYYTGDLDINMPDYIYVIADEDFDTIGFDTVSMTYYSDGKLVDEDDRVVPAEEVVNVVGDGIKSMNNGNLDVICVRNDYYEIDYEIIRDDRPYGDE